MWSFFFRNYIPCTPENVIEAVATQYPFSVAGLLFFHHECRYTPGVTPLALWLTPELLEERLGIPIPPLPPPIQLVVPAGGPDMQVEGIECMDSVPDDDAVVEEEGDDALDTLEPNFDGAAAVSL